MILLRIILLTNKNNATPQMMKQIKFMIFTIYIVSKFLILFSLPVDQVLEVRFDFKNVCNFFICRNEIIITRNKTVHFR